MNDLRKGIVRILNKSGQKTLGTGFIVSTELMVTCAHVIDDPKKKPPDTVRCKRLVDDQHEFEALVEEEYWRDQDHEDVAFLRVNTPFPEDIPLKLGTSANIAADHPFDSYGFPEKHPKGLPVEVTIRGETVDGNRLVLRSKEIVEGVSGAPVIDLQTHLIVGMVCERIKPHSTEVKEKITLRQGVQTLIGYLQTTKTTGRLEDLSYAIPSSVLLKICSELSIEYTCPYLGLSAFTENEERFFFGRDELVKNLKKKLGSSPEFLAVVGSSGSGKSSVVQAGLFPKLQRGELLGFPQNVPIFKLRPSNEDTPEESLLTAFFGVQYSESEESGDVWARVQHYLKQHSSRSIIFIDQFEELFALFPDKQEAFTRGLYDLVKAVSEVTLIITMRSDFYEPLQNSALGHFLPEYQENMPKGFVDDEELRIIITEPAKQVGLKLGEGLVDLILTDLKQTKNPLPLLEFTLEQLWQVEHKNNWLTRECYLSDRIGGVTGAIAQWANKTYRNLPSETEKALARRIFTRLIHYGSASSPDKNSTDVPDTRRRLPLTELISIGESSVVRSLINKLVDARLLVTDDHTVEIIHDALITEWTELGWWISGKRAFLFWRQRLDGSLWEWQDKKKKGEEGDFLYGAALGEAEGYLNNDEYRAELNKKERNYIEASVRLRDRQIEWEKQQQQNLLDRERDARKAAEKTTIVIIFSSLLIISGLIFWYLSTETRKIKEEIVRIEEDLEQDPLKALISAIALTNRNQLLTKVIPGVKSSLRKAVEKSREINRVIWSQKKIDDFESITPIVALSKNGKYIITSYNDGTVNSFENSTSIHKKKLHDFSIRLVVMSHNGEYFFTQDTKQNLLFSTKAREEAIFKSRHKTLISSASVSENGQYFVISDNENGVTTVWLYDNNEQNNKLIPIFSNDQNTNYDNSVLSVAISNDGNFVVIGTQTSLRLLDNKGTTISECFYEENGNGCSSKDSFSSIAISGNGQYIVTGHSDGSLQLFEITPNLQESENALSIDRKIEVKDTKKEHRRYIRSVAITHDGQYIASGSSDKNSSFLRNTEGELELIYQLLGHEGAVNSIAINPKQDIIVTGSNDGTIRWWDTNTDDIGKNWETWLEIGCNRLQKHPVIKDEDEDVKNAQKACNKVGKDKNNSKN